MNRKQMHHPASSNNDEETVVPSLAALVGILLTGLLYLVLPPNLIIGHLSGTRGQFMWHPTQNQLDFTESAINRLTKCVFGNPIIAQKSGRIQPLLRTVSILGLSRPEMLGEPPAFLGKGGKSPWPSGPFSSSHTTIRLAHLLSPC
jgi:hypothetical protein